MKITDFIIIYLIIISPILLYTNWKADDTTRYERVNQEYDEAFKLATYDAVNQMKKNATPSYEYGYDKPKFSRVNKEEAYDTFLRTLSINFGVEDDITLDVLDRYVPVFTVMEYDGIMLSTYEKFAGTNGAEWRRVWLPKIPFTYHDNQGNIVQFTLDDHVKVYDVGLGEWLEGYRKEIIKESNMEVLQNPVEFEQVRRNVIVKTVQENLAYQINKHNVYTKQLGITYRFAMPLIPQDEWYNTLQDVGVFAFFQGYPYTRSHGVYNQYAFAGGKLGKEEVYYATVVDGKKVFYSGDCGFNYPKNEIYQTKKDAAKEGYYELSCLNK